MIINIKLLNNINKYILVRIDIKYISVIKIIIYLDIQFSKKTYSSK